MSNLPSYPVITEQEIKLAEASLVYAKAKIEVQTQIYAYAKARKAETTSFDKIDQIYRDVSRLAGSYNLEQAERIVYAAVQGRPFHGFGGVILR